LKTGRFPNVLYNTVTIIANGTEGVLSTLVANGTVMVSTTVANGSERVKLLLLLLRMNVIATL